MPQRPVLPCFLQFPLLSSSLTSLGSFLARADIQVQVLIHHDDDPGGVVLCTQVHPCLYPFKMDGTIARTRPTGFRPLIPTR